MLNRRVIGRVLEAIITTGKEERKKERKKENEARIEYRFCSIYWYNVLEIKINYSNSKKKEKKIN